MLVCLLLGASPVYAGEDSTPQARPKWLTVELEERARFEALSSDFRSASKPDGAALVNRLLLRSEVRFESFVGGLELADSRAIATSGTLLNTTIVDPFEVLRAYVGLTFSGLLAPADVATVTLGRLTLDIGSRRLQARNEFRNTINTFTGLELKYLTPEKHLLRGFASVPVERLPTGDAALARNDVQFNVERFNRFWWGLFFGSAPGHLEMQFEGYLFGLHERDAEGLPTTNRNLVTPGVRLFRAPKVGALDFQFEGMAQLGTVRASTMSSEQHDLEHWAGSLHAQVGYLARLRFLPRLSVAWDFASGDADPTDDKSNRFDPLYGARRFEWGPTGLYGAFSRTNINSAVARLELAPHERIDAFVSWRAVWLASASDGWVVAGLRDKSGASGSFVGDQLEGRVRFKVGQNNLAFDVGGALFFAGEFTRATQPRGVTQSAYGYVQVSAWL